MHVHLKRRQTGSFHTRRNGLVTVVYYLLYQKTLCFKQDGRETLWRLRESETLMASQKHDLHLIHIPHRQQKAIWLLGFLVQFLRGRHRRQQQNQIPGKSRN